jgi:zinc protease
LNDLSKDWKGDAVIIPAYEIPQQSNVGKVFFIDVPNSKQSVLRIGKLALNSINQEANRLDFTNDKLGGGSSGTLFQTLRIEKGYTYGMYSGVAGGLEIQPFSASGSVRANATKASLDIIRDMIANYAKDFSVEDVETTKQKLVKGNTSAFESLGAKLGILRQISKYAKALNYVEQEQEELVAMSLEDFKATANKYLDESEMIYVIVGDKATQFEPVKKFAGGEVIELDIYGNVL